MRHTSQKFSSQVSPFWAADEIKRGDSQHYYCSHCQLHPILQGLSLGGFILMDAFVSDWRPLSNQTEHEFVGPTRADPVPAKSEGG